MLVSIDHVNMSVSNLDQAAQFYGVFGFEEVEAGVRNGVPWRILRSADSMLCLYRRPENAGPGGSIGHMGFALDAIDDALLDSLRERGGSLNFGGERFRRPFSTSVYVEDPDGNEIELTVWDEGRVRFPLPASEVE